MHLPSQAENIVLAEWSLAFLLHTCWLDRYSMHIKECHWSPLLTNEVNFHQGFNLRLRRNFFSFPTKHTDAVCRLSKERSRRQFTHSPSMSILCDVFLKKRGDLLLMSTNHLQHACLVSLTKPIPRHIQVMIIHTTFPRLLSV
jgi:hypothetical protein